MINHLDEIQARITEKAHARLSEPPQAVRFTGNVEADKLLNDLDTCPHAFVFACLMDRQDKAERVWLIPYHLQNRLGSFTFSDLANLSEEKVATAMSKPTPLHRFSLRMSQLLFLAIQRVREVYDGDASKIWTGEPSSAAIVRRFLEFEGIGPKIATMAANILVRDFRIPVSDSYSIDLSADVHVRRVFSRLGFVPLKASEDLIIYTARERYPKYPGIFDLGLWELGRSICQQHTPRCNLCYLADLCPSAHKIK